jgi:hypothetical protein
MLAVFTSSLGAMVATYVLVFLFPTVCAVGFGLVIIGFMRVKPSAILVGIAFPGAVLVFALVTRANALASASAPPTLGKSMDAITAFLPLSLAIAGLIFLVRMLPSIVRAARRG